MNPYESPTVSEKPQNEHPPPRQTSIIREYFSLSGSFSRIELLIATLGIGGLFFLRSQLLALVTHGVFSVILVFSAFALYLSWGVALGKRSRDLGTTFTYGMLVGMLFPIIGIIFLFQDGKKFKASKRKNVAEQGGADDR